MPAPTLQDFRARHPAFVDTPDLTVSAYLTDAAGAVAYYIPEEIQPRCVMMIAAHELTLEGFGDASSAGLAGAKAAGAKRIKDGATEVEFFIGEGTAQTTADQLLASTSYGRRYIAIKDQYKPIGFAV